MGDLLPLRRLASLAACKDKDPVLFFGYDNEPYADRVIREADAKVVCAGCNIRSACLAGADARNEPDGIWGGENADERRLRRRREQRRQKAGAA